MSAERQVIREPKRWAYMKMLHGRHVNPLHLMKMMEREHKEQQSKLIHAICAATGHFAVSSVLLTKHKRTKYAGNRIREGNQSFYLFDRRYCPADIGTVIDLKSNQVIYQ